ncbi:unnamed protein product [Natator depressus]
MLPPLRPKPQFCSSHWLGTAANGSCGGGDCGRRQHMELGAEGGEFLSPFQGHPPGKSCDKGQSFLSEIPESPATSSYRNIIQRIQEYCGLKHSQEKLSNQGME